MRDTGYYWARESNRSRWFVVYFIKGYAVVSEIGSSNPRSVDELVFGPNIPEYKGE